MNAETKIKWQNRLFATLINVVMVSATTVAIVAHVPA